jgi:hypothetical protein
MPILGAILLIGGLCAAWLGFHAIREREVAKKWPISRGTVLSSEILSCENYSKTGTNVTYELAVTYEYWAEGERYISDKVVLTGGYKTPFRGEAERLKDLYNPGDLIKVYYEPKDPKISLLIPGQAGEAGLALSMVLGGVLFVVISVIMLIQRLLVLCGTKN